MTTTVDTNHAATLADAITRRLPDAQDLAAPAHRIADDLVALGRLVPAEDWLILGGSMARGEPTLIHHHGGRVLISDVDLLYVHSAPEPAKPLDQLKAMAERCFPSVDIMVLPEHQYRHLHTSLGYDFKNLGLDLAGHGLPEHTPVRLDDRDAYEI
ncbi:nucleotidyltransferase domain-containing protein [Nocardia farcinica]|nr:nucleotidyltransferase domain-containing protein [Nocardia farcinica]MBF6072791.1 nucleotidyltransferase domain-containing protein [Nocardia farcinica]